MRLALIYLGRRGAGIPISYELAEHLSHQADVLVVLSQHIENLSLWQSSGLELLTTTTYRALPGAIWSWIDQFKMKQLAERIRTWKPDVLLFPMFHTWNPFLQWHLRDIPGVVAVHDPISHPGIADFAFKLLEDLSIRQAKRCIVFSQMLAPELSRRGIERQYVDFVPLGEFSYYQRYLSQTSTRESAEQPKLLFFGRITAYKGLEVLLRAYGQLGKTHKVQLMVVGEGNLNAFRSLLNEMPHVQLINQWVNEEDIAAIFNQAAIVILPYTSASQSGVLPIAASFGLPVIATRVGGIPEQIEHETSGLLVEPGSVSELVAAIHRLLEEPLLARQLGENLQREFRENKNWEVIAGKVFDICTMAMHHSLVES
jgi:glycosyltransferase involved in cell wall biosynthesis